MEHSESLLLEQEVASLIVQTVKEAGLIQRTLKEGWDGSMCDQHAVKPFITLLSGKEKGMYGNRRRARNLKKWSNIALGVFLLLLATGCHHSIRFEDIGYSLGQKEFDAGLIAVITPETVAQGRPITSIMTGAAHTWEAHPGEMLKQIAEVEFPQMVRYYRTASSYEEPKEGAKRLTVELSVPHYDFSEFHATVVIQAKAYGPGRTLIFDKSYREEGDRQGAKMFWGGAFAMKSAIRQSSFQAYQAAFAKLRFDLGLFFVKPGP